MKLFTPTTITLIIFFLIIIITSIFLLTFLMKTIKKDNEIKHEKWYIISTEFVYYYDGIRKNTFEFKKKIPAFLQLIVSNNTFYFFLDKQGKKEIVRKIKLLIKTKKIEKNEKKIYFFLKINLKKIKCYIKFFQINNKSKIIKGVISNLF